MSISAREARAGRVEEHEKYEFTPVPERAPPDDPAPGVWRPNMFRVARDAYAGDWTMEPQIAELVCWGNGSELEPDCKDSTLDALPYGAVAAVGDIACVSQEIGVSCWNSITQHGFLVSRQSYVTW